MPEVILNESRPQRSFQALDQLLITSAEGLFLFDQESPGRGWPESARIREARRLIREEREALEAAAAEGE